MIKKLLLTALVLFAMTGCQPNPPPYPTTDPCLGLHTIGLPQCSPPDDEAPAMVPHRPEAAVQPTGDASQPASAAVPGGALRSERTVTILVDDFTPQPYQGDDHYFYNRLEGDRGALNNSLVSWDMGQAKITLSSGSTWGGIWMSLNHPIREKQSIDFSAVLPPQIRQEYQSRITGMTVTIAGGTPSKLFRVELKDSHNNLQWSRETMLSGGPETMDWELPPLQAISQLVLVLDQASGGDFVAIDNISLTAATPVTDPAVAAFVWSYGMLLNNWDPSTGLVRDKAKDASGEFDAIQATGSLAAATALAEQAGVVNPSDAAAVVNRISTALLNELPRNHGLWPHWVRRSTDGRFEIVPGTEWSSVDTVIAAIGLLDARQALGLDTSATEQVLRDVEWNSLVSEKGISHGYTFDGTLIPYAWDVFGGESWLVELAYAGATGSIAPLAYPSPPTANGSGFIDELAWLYVKPPAGRDFWGTDWNAYRAASAEAQIRYYSTKNPSSCLAQSGLFGLSAAEVPGPAQVSKENIYQAFGVGGRFSPGNDGSRILGSPVIAAHYSAMISSLRSEDATKMWDWLIGAGYFSPLTNVESLAFQTGSDCTSVQLEWNQLKGSWNLALQTLGWGRYLVERSGNTPSIWQATKDNLFLRRGYLLLAPNEPEHELSVILPGQNLPRTMGSLSPRCSEEADYKRSLPGMYGYQMTAANGAALYFTITHTKGSQDIQYDSWGWPPKDDSIPPWVSTTTHTQMEDITTRFGTLHALRLDTLQE